MAIYLNSEGLGLLMEPLETWKAFSVIFWAIRTCPHSGSVVINTMPVIHLNTLLFHKEGRKQPYKNRKQNRWHHEMLDTPLNSMRRLINPCAWQRFYAQDSRCGKKCGSFQDVFTNGALVSPLKIGIRIIPTHKVTVVAGKWINILKY